MTKSLTVFHYAGKNYIGYYCSFNQGEIPSFTGINQSINDKYVFQCPAEISYKINITADATADLVSSVMPLYPGDFFNGTKDTVYFAFPKADTVVSSIKEANIHANIVSQYKQLTKLS